jgi:hypothetical protein
MRYALAILALGFLGCSPAVTIQPRESVQFKLSRLVAEGAVPCKVQIFADSELVFDLSATGDVRCPLPQFKPVADVTVEPK